MLITAPVAHFDDLFYDAMMRNPPPPSLSNSDDEFTWERQFDLTIPGQHDVGWVNACAAYKYQPVAKGRAKLRRPLISVGEWGMVSGLHGQLIECD